MNEPFTVREYVEGGRSPFAEWFEALDAATAVRVQRYIRRLEAGNFGAAKPLREGVCELRCFIGPLSRRRGMALDRVGQAFESLVNLQKKRSGSRTITRIKPGQP